MTKKDKHKLYGILATVAFHAIAVVLLFNAAYLLDSRCGAVAEYRSGERAWSAYSGESAYIRIPPCAGASAFLSGGAA